MIGSSQSLNPDNIFRPNKNPFFFILSSIWQQCLASTVHYRESNSLSYRFKHHVSSHYVCNHFCYGSVLANIFYTIAWRDRKLLNFIMFLAFFFCLKRFWSYKEVEQIANQASSNLSQLRDFNIRRYYRGTNVQNCDSRAHEWTVCVSFPEIRATTPVNIVECSTLELT